MGDCGVRQARRPGVELSTAADSERQVVQAGPGLVERVLSGVPVLGEPQASVQAVVPEEHLAACPAGRIELAREPEAEHFLVPGRARVNVTNRQSEMVDPCDHACSLCPCRAASRILEQRSMSLAELAHQVFDITVAHQEAEARVRAALDAGGRLVDDSFARSFWVLADAEGNEVCVCTWTDRDEREQ